MADTTRTEMVFAKRENSKQQVEDEAKALRASLGVVSATVEERGDNWIIVVDRKIIE